LHEARGCNSDHFLSVSQYNEYYTDPYCGRFKDRKLAGNWGVTSVRDMQDSPPPTSPLSPILGRLIPPMSTDTLLSLNYIHRRQTPTQRATYTFTQTGMFLIYTRPPLPFLFFPLYGCFLHSTPHRIRVGDASVSGPKEWTRGVVIQWRGW
jgi:hypothetical protein